MSVFSFSQIEQQKTVYSDFLDYVTDNVHDKGSRELTIEDFDDTDKTAAYVICTVMYIDRLCVDDFIYTISQFYAYDQLSLQMENGSLVARVYIAWQLVPEMMPAPHRTPKRAKRRTLSPPGLWEIAVMSFSAMGVVAFAALKQPLLGWP